MPQTLAQIALVVRDYDEAITFFTQRLGFVLIEDSALSQDKRWVVVKPNNPGSAALLLAKAATPEQQSAIGNQAGGRVAFFLLTDDFWRDHHAMQSSGVKFLEPPREEPYGTVAVFEDLYGNKWDLLMPRSAS